MSSTTHIVRIQDLFEQWRSLGSMRLPNGCELVGRVPEDDSWMHVMHPGLDAAALNVVQREIGAPMPSSLRAFYRCCGGLSLFRGMFELFGRWRSSVMAPMPKDIVRLNHQLDVLGWKPDTAIAFAQNGWDMSVHLAGMGETGDEVVRCEWATGQIVERHPDVFACVDARLHRIDAMMVG